METTSRDLLAALDFAAHKHCGQQRKGRGSPPYVNHLIEVAEILARVGKVSERDVLVAAVLHDTLEDTETTRRELVARFGSGVAGLVAEVTDDKSLSKHERKRLQVEHAPGLSRAAKLIKLGDKICNLREVAESPPLGWPRPRRIDYLRWSRDVVAGCRGTSPALEREFDRVARRAAQLL